MRTDRWRESGRRDHQVDEKLHLPRKEKVGLEEELGAVFFFERDKSISSYQL